MPDASAAAGVADLPLIAGVEPYASGRGWVLYCADSEALLAAGALPGGCAIVSDPPYGVGYTCGDSGRGWQHVKAHRRTGAAAKIIGDSVPFDPRPWLEYARAVAAPRGNKKTLASMRIALCGADHFAARLPEGVGCLLCWDKCAGGGPEDSFADAEFAWIGTRTARRIFRYLWKGRIRGKEGEDHLIVGRQHVSQKPVGLMTWLMDRNTGVAALRQGRACILIEIDPAHCETAAARLRAAEAALETTT